MLKQRTRKSSGGPDSSEADASTRTGLAGQALAGLIEAGVIMAAADGHIAEEEMAVVAGIIDGFCKGQASEEQVKQLMVDAGTAIDRDGILVRTEYMAKNLYSPELRRVGLLVAASVMICDGDFAAGTEDQAYITIAQALGFSREGALSVLDEAAAMFE